MQDVWCLAAPSPWSLTVRGLQVWNLLGVALAEYALFSQVFQVLKFLLNLRMALALERTAYARRKLNPIPSPQTGPFTTAMYGSGYSNQAAWCSVPLANAAPRVESPRILQPQTPGYIAWDLTIPCLPSSPQQLQPGSYRLLYGLFIPKFSVLRLGFLSVWFSRAASFHVKYFFGVYPAPPRCGDLWRLSKHTVSLKIALGERGSQEASEASVGKRRVRKYLIQGVPNLVPSFTSRTPHSCGSFQGTQYCPWDPALGLAHSVLAQNPLEKEEIFLVISTHVLFPKNILEGSREVFPSDLHSPVIPKMHTRWQKTLSW